MQNLCELLQELSKEKSYFVLAIDGMCASGKTTLASYLAKKLDANVIHIDDFYLPAEQQKNQAGGNIDFRRFQEEVHPLKPTAISYRRFDCTTQTLSQIISLPFKRILIVEGTYSLFPTLGKYYDFSIFKEIDKEEQKRRLLDRSPKQFEKFLNLWIPLEQSYFSAYEVAEKCDRILKMEETE